MSNLFLFNKRNDILYFGAQKLQFHQKHKRFRDCKFEQSQATQIVAFDVEYDSFFALSFIFFRKAKKYHSIKMRKKK